MHRPFLVAAAVLGALAVILGAFAAHTLKQILPPAALSTFQTGVSYQFYHVFALLGTGILSDRFGKRWIRPAGYCFIAGIVLFSGSLYALAALQASANVGLGGLGILTPIGGLFFIAGWILLAVACASKQHTLKSV